MPKTSPRTIGFLLCLFGCTSLFGRTEADAKKILKDLVPGSRGLHLVPKDFVFDSPQTALRTQRWVEGDFNRDRNRKIAICAIKKLGEGHYDGYLIVGALQAGKWKPAFEQKFPDGSGPSLKWNAKAKRLFFFLSYSSEPVLELLWDPKEKKYYMGDIAPNTRL